MSLSRPWWRGLRDRRWWWLVGLAALAFGLPRVQFDADILDLLPSDVPVVRGLKLYQEAFANSQELLITVRTADADAAEMAAERVALELRSASNLVAAAVWRGPWLDHPEDLAELVAWLWLNQPPDAVARLHDRLSVPEAPQVLGSAREELATSLSPLELGRLAYDPLGLSRLPGEAFDSRFMPGDHAGWFGSPDGTFHVIFVEPRHRLSGYRHAAEWLEAVRGVLGRCRQSEDWPRGAVVRLTGAPAFLVETATTMERDLRGSALGTVLLIAVMFWLAHRRWLPLVWLVTLLLLVVAGTVVVGGLVLGSINLVSLGFAAILMGLGVDYGLVLYQESLASPHTSAAGLRRRVVGGIRWSAVTTASSFGLLAFAGLPGLAQLGLLVALGVVLAAGTMLTVFLPVVRRGQPARSAILAQSESDTKVPPPVAAPGPAPSPVEAVRVRPVAAGRAGLLASGVVLLAAAAVLWRGLPAVDHGTRPLELTESRAQTALDELQRELDREGSPLMLVLTGRDEVEVGRKLEAADALLASARTNGTLRSYLLPTALWPQPARQATNRGPLGDLALASPRLQAAAIEAGFTSNAWLFASAVLRHWERMSGASDVTWPTNASCQWLLKRFSARHEQGWLAAGALHVANPGEVPGPVAAWANETPGVWLTGWPLVGEALLARVEGRLAWLVATLGAVLVVCLWLAFRRWTEVLLSFGALAFSFLLLLAVMRLAGWSWNLMNLTALPLMLGAGVDYTIHVQLGLRRHGGSPRAMRRVTGRALWLCAATTVAGFGSLAWASNAGLSSLGLVCATGILSVYVVSVGFLPSWWVLFGCGNGRGVAPFPPDGAGSSGPASPATGLPVQSPKRSSSLYRAGYWRVGHALVRVLPRRVVDAVCQLLAEISFRMDAGRRQIVVDNLLPVLAGDRNLASRTARRLYRRFAVKIADLLRLEAGSGAWCWEAEPREREIIQTALARKRGVLFLTPHLGNWEHGGLLLTDMGIELTVLTLGEPEDDLTEMRAASRERWGMRTLVIGRDSFALVEVIKRLQAGAAMAVAMDRPAEHGGVLVNWFGRPFRASAVAVELARASGCALVGVTFMRRQDRLVVKVLPEFGYDRRELGDREARRALTGQILRAFEPYIREHADQWYHFVPIWPRPESL